MEQRQGRQYPLVGSWRIEVAFDMHMYMGDLGLQPLTKLEAVNAVKLSSVSQRTGLCE